MCVCYEQLSVMMYGSYGGSGFSDGPVTLQLVSFSPLSTIAPSSAGLYGRFSVGPQYIGEYFRVPMYANSNSNDLRSWSIEINYDSSVLTYVSFTHDSSRWGSPSIVTSTNQVVITATSQTTQLGSNIFLGYAMMQVKDLTSIAGKLKLK